NAPSRTQRPSADNARRRTQRPSADATPLGGRNDSRRGRPRVRLPDARAGAFDNITTAGAPFPQTSSVLATRVRSELVPGRVPLILAFASLATSRRPPRPPHVSPAHTSRPTALQIAGADLARAGLRARDSPRTATDPATSTPPR